MCSRIQEDLTPWAPPGHTPYTQQPSAGGLRTGEDPRVP